MMKHAKAARTRQLVKNRFFRTVAALFTGLVFLEAVLLDAASASLQPPGSAFNTAAERGLNRQQIRNLTTWIQVWGFTKYHHPQATSGARDWDAEFVKLLVPMTKASADAAADNEIIRWLNALGPVAGCGPCAKSVGAAITAPTEDWLASEGMAPQLRTKLKQIYDYRPVAQEQHYVKAKAGVGNAVFPNESSIGSPADPATRLLTLARYWNVIRYWFPYRNLIARDWNNALEAYVPDFASADKEAAYIGAIYRLVGELGDGHSAVSAKATSTLNAPATSTTRLCLLPVDWRFSGERLTVYRDARENLKRGDVVLAIDGVPIATLEQRLEQTRRASLNASQLNRSENFILAGKCQAATLTVKRGVAIKSIELTRIPAAEGFAMIGSKSHDRAGASFQLLPNNVAYLKLSNIKRSDIPAYMERARSTRGLIVDIRAYPAEFVPFALGQFFARIDTPFVKITRPDLQTPGAFNWSEPVLIKPAVDAKPLTIPLVVLVDAASVSQSEYTAMALRAVGGRIVGSTTAGADGNLTTLPLPTGETAAFSGIGIFYPDGQPTQRIGIVPDIFVEPTPEGVAAGRDEVLEAALKLIAS